MARYIDADRLMTKIHELYVQPNIELWQVVKCVGNSPTADVAPKSEVAELICKLECLLCHVTGGRLSKHTYDLRTMETVATDCINETYNDGFGEGYKECAREIIADVREQIEGYENIDIILDRIEKKYTGDKE